MLLHKWEVFKAAMSNQLSQLLELSRATKAGTMTRLDTPYSKAIVLQKYQNFITLFSNKIATLLEQRSSILAQAVMLHSVLQNTCLLSTE